MLALAAAALMVVAPLAPPLLPAVSSVAAGSRLADETLPPSPPPVATVAVDLEIAGGHMSSPATDFGMGVSAPSGSYVTFRVSVAAAVTDPPVPVPPVVADLPVEFLQKTGRDGTWALLSTGRTDAAGVVLWSRLLEIPAPATENDRHTYFRVSVFDPLAATPVTSQEVFALASDSAEPFLIAAPGGLWEDGVATWYCLPGRSICTKGYDPDGMYAAISRGYGIPLDSYVNVCRGESCVTVKLIDTCAASSRCIDLYAGAFERLAPLSTGRIPVTIQLLGSGGQPPPTEPPEPSLPTVSLRVTGGYRADLESSWSNAAYVRNGTYLTLRATMEPPTAGVPVSFYQRVGKSGEWVFLSRGRTDASGTAVWSRVVRVPAGATGYDRYVYYRVSVPDGADGEVAWSNAVRGVAR